MCRIIPLVVFEGSVWKAVNLFWKVWDRGLEVATKSAASAASRKTKSRGPRSREAPGRRLGKRTATGRGTPLEPCPLDVFFLEAALAADLSKSKSIHLAPAGNPFLDPAV